jgi:hypothetical protein
MTPRESRPGTNRAADISAAATNFDISTLREGSPIGALHGRSCTQRCKDAAISSPLDRPNRPPAVPCSWCGAPAGVACVVKVRGRRSRRPLTVFGPFHPSRIEGAA